jgi:rSAM/selenodomain-associated transferase 2/rSAM/selenodomain-associated transferase 1
MHKNCHVTVIIPALNEESSIGKLIPEIPSWVDRIIVADNGSVDRTAEIAVLSGAEVVRSPERGYGSACLAAMAVMPGTDIVVFLDADYSDDPSDMHGLVEPIIENRSDVIIGSRVLGNIEPGSLTPQQRWGNWIATQLILLFWNVRFTDLGPFRAVRYHTLMQLGMTDSNFGWTVELQVKAARGRVRCIEVPVRYRKRIGVSKISGTVRGVLAAGSKILWTIFREALWPGRAVRHQQSLIILFTRLPEPGRSKTRLIPALGAQGAADLHQSMMTRTIRRVSGFCELNPPSLEIRLAGTDDCSACRHFRGENFRVRPQGPGDLGLRLKRAFHDAFNQGYSRVVAIGTDTPALDERHLDEAFRVLRQHDAVIGPVEDGGYYLIGSSRRCPSIFESIDWGGEHVFSQTIMQFEKLKLTWCKLEKLHDVDHPEDLHVWEKETGLKTRVPGAEGGGHEFKHVQESDISIIIPTLNEEEAIGETIQAACDPHLMEVIVVDGNSSDNTLAVAESVGARIIHAPRGRAGQLNLGAAEARGRYFVFLHADTILPDDYGKTVREILKDYRVSAGAFKFSINRRGLRYRLIDLVTHWRARFLQLPYGDQGLFMTREIFEQTGGYPEIPFMDDFEFVGKLRGMGKIRIAPTPAQTSPRRWIKLGAFRTTFINQVVLIGYRLGVKPEKLKRWYGERAEAESPESGS